MVVSRTNYEITNEPHARRVVTAFGAMVGLQFGGVGDVREGALRHEQRCKVGNEFEVAKANLELKGHDASRPWSVSPLGGIT